MEKLGEGLKKILLAGIGTVAVTAEKSKEVLDEMVKKGELTVEQGKVLNQELKHSIKQTVKEKVNVSVKPSSPEELSELLGKMSPEQLAQLKEQILNVENAGAEAPQAAEVPQAAEEAPVSDAGVEASQAAEEASASDAGETADTEVCAESEIQTEKAGGEVNE